MGIPYVTGPNPMEVGQYIQQGFQQGRAERDKNTLAKLAQQAYNAPQEQQRGLIGQAIGVDPTAGFALQKGLGDSRDAEVQSLGQAAQWLAQLPPETQAAQYPALVEQARRAGFPLPDHAFDPTQVPNIAKLGQMIAMKAGSGVPASLQEFNAMSQGMSAEDQAKARRINLGLDPRALAPQVIQGAGGMYGVDRQNLTAAPITVGGAPQGQQVNPAGTSDAMMAAANFMAQKGVPADQIDAWLQQQMGGQSPQPQSMPTPSAPMQQAPQQLQAPPKAAPAPSEMDRKIAYLRAHKVPEDKITQMVMGGNAGAVENGLTPDGQALLASAMSHGYTLPIPNMGMGAAGTSAKMKAVNDLAASFVDQGIDPNDAVSAMIQGKTATGGLAQLQKTAAGVRGWESSAQNQAKIALEMSNKVGRTGIPVFNKWLLAGRKSIEGDVDVQRFSNASDTFAEEYAKVIGAGNAAATDSARAQAHSMINTAQTAEQYQGVVSLMQREMSQRNAGLDSAIQAQRDAVIGKKAPDAPTIIRYDNKGNRIP